MDASDADTLDVFLRACVTPGTLDSFLVSRVSTADMAGLVADLVCAEMEAGLRRRLGLGLGCGGAGAGGGGCRENNDGNGTVGTRTTVRALQPQPQPTPPPSPASAVGSFAGSCVGTDAGVDAGGASTASSSVLPPGTRARVLELRDVAEALWADLQAAEPCLRPAGLDAGALVTALRQASSSGSASAATATAARIDAVVAFVAAAVRGATARFLLDVRSASAAAKRRAVVRVVGEWERTTLGRTERAVEPVRRISASTGGAVLRPTLGASRAEMERVANTLGARFDAIDAATTDTPTGTPTGTAPGTATRATPLSLLLQARDLEAIRTALRTASTTGALSFSFHVFTGDWETVFLALPQRHVLGLPAPMMREARPFGQGTSDEDKEAVAFNPATVAPKPAGGALPPPTQFVYTVGRGADGFVGLGNTELCAGGGLLVVLPGWHGFETAAAARAHARPRDGDNSDTDGGASSGSRRFYAHYLRVNPTTHVGTVLRVTEGAAGRSPTARAVLRFELDVPSPEPEPDDEDDDDDEDARGGGGGGGSGEGRGAEAAAAPARAIDWIDAQREFEAGALVLSWGGYNPLTGGAAWTCSMVLQERDAYAKGEDPFQLLDEDGTAEVAHMFATRLESGRAVDFRDHGSLVTAEVRQVVEDTPQGRFMSPVTRVVYHDTVVKELLGVEAVAVWGTAHAFVVWTTEGHGATLRGATRGDVTDGAVQGEPLPALVTRGRGRGHAEEASARVVSIAPWWQPLP